MSSNFYKIFIALIFLSACGEKSPAPGARVLGGGSACVKQSAQGFSDFIEGAASDDDVKSIYQCMDSMVQLFKDRTQGAEKGIYTEKEIQDFAKTYFFKNGVSPDLWNELLFAKTIVLGGNTTSLTKSELERLRSIIESARTMSLETRTWFPVTQLSRKSDLQFNNGMKSISDFLSVLFIDTNKPYPTDRLKKLVLLVSNQSESSTDFAQFINMGLASYEISFQPVANPTLGKNNIRELVELSKDIFKINKSITQFMQPDQSLFIGKGLENVYSAGISLLKVLNRTIERRYLYWFNKTGNKTSSLKKAPISVNELGYWVDRVSINSKFMGVTTKSLKSILEPTVVKFLGSGKFNSIAPSWIENVRLLLNSWYSEQKSVNLAFKIATGTDDFKNLRVSKSALFGALESQEYNDLLLSDDVKWDVEAMLGSVKPVLGFESRVLSLEPEGLRAGVTHFGTSFYLGIRLALQNLIQGYADSTPGADNTVLTRDGLNRVISDITPLGLELLILDPESVDVYKKRFLEANLFLPSATGNNFVDVQELSELIIYLSSAGKKGTDIQKDIALKCAGFVSVAPEKYGYPRIKNDCFKKEFVPYLAEYFNYLPDFYAYLKPLSGMEKQAFFDTVLKAGNLYASAKRDEMSEDDSQGLAALLQYIETLFLKFDTNHSGTIDYDESAIAFHQFKTELRIINSKVSKVNDEKLIEIFTYILANGKAPDVFQAAWWITKSSNYKTKRVRADRLQILKVFEAMVSGARSN
ncbi:MAG: hypothetical protein KA715_08270 [Xanthomonadaceae bacterium]|nr:hypothetical protein [Xanthomonadaceae bacterium]